MFRLGSLPWRAIIWCAVWSLSLAVPRPALAAQEPTASPAKKPVIAVFQLHEQVSERTADDALPLFGTPGPSLKDVVARMKKAVEDPDVKAVVVLCDGAGFGFAQAEELRQAMKKVRDARKDVYAHADSLSIGYYLLLSGASRLSVTPTGDLWVMGLYGEQPYLHGLLEKLGVQGDFLHCGAYKSAAEIFMRDGPSPEADQMTNWLLDSLYARLVKQIAAGRNVGEEQVRGWIDGGPYTAEKAKAAGMIDAVEHREDLEAVLHEKYGKDAVFEKHYGSPKKEEVDLSNPFAFFAAMAKLMGGGGAEKSPAAKKAAVGIVYVDGAIVLGRSDSSLFGSSAAASTDVARALDEAARDDSVKAVVLRIDSPGGSATASEVILAASQRLKAKKPLIVSMGDVAGSGGYYVACAADTIFADEGTITGSIGVVGGKFVTTPMWDKIGVKWKPYQRGANADMLSSDAPFTAAQRQRLQAWMDDVYGVFKQHVTAIRGDRLKKPIEDLAGGRVYTGRQALDLGLVDKIGTMEDAIGFAAARANLKDKDYDVRTVPEPKNFLQRLMEQAAGGSGESDPERLGGAAPPAFPLPQAGAGSLWKLAAPYLAELDPQRARLIRDALGQVQLLQREGVILMMPPGRYDPCGK